MQKPRKEMVPDWLKEEPKEQEKETVKKDVSKKKDASTLDDERKRLEEVLKNISVINRREWTLFEGENRYSKFIWKVNGKYRKFKNRYEVIKERK